LAKKARSVGVIIVAGGSGIRFGGKTPKQFFRLNGKTILERSVARFALIPAVREVVVAVPVSFSKNRTVAGLQNRYKKISGIVSGGKTRQESVWNGLMGFRSNPDVVLVHDAVRPFVTRNVIIRVIAATQQHRAAVVGVPVSDTIKREIRKGFYGKTVDRRLLWTVQTPQGFMNDLLIKAHEKAVSNGFVGTDEASLVERIGVPVRIVEGSQMNIKITTREDLRLAKVLAKRQP